MEDAIRGNDQLRVEEVVLGAELVVVVVLRKPRIGRFHPDAPIRLDRAGLTEPCNSFVGKTQSLVQNRIGVLAKQRRMAANFGGRVGHDDRRADHANVPRSRMRHVDDHPTMLNLGMFKRLLDRVDRSAGNAGRGHAVEPDVGIFSFENLLQSRNQHLTIGDPARIRRETFVTSNFRVTHQAAK